MFIISHRGCRNRWCENTLGAFDDAIRFSEANPKLRGIELDVQLTADGEAVLLHNPSLWVADGQEWVLSRTTHAKLTEYTDKCDDPLGRICPRLEDVLKFVDHRTPLFCEIKAYDYDFATMADILRRLMEAYRPAGDIILNSFSIPMMEQIMKTCDMEGVKFALVFSSIDAITRAQSLMERLDYLHPHYDLLGSDTETFRAPGKPLNIWTVNREDILKRIVGLEIADLVEGVMTDDVSLVRYL
ncbi:MAG: glycerophosphodiester phosphodiesterase [Phycisphaerae bacterium]|nr:glycerophosphodiester phosphodiesterase [Phycisphaerae bacterium]